MSTLDELISTVQQLALNITGVADPDARRKYDTECDELHVALSQGDWQAALTEAADVGWYIGKMYLNYLADEAECLRLIDLLIAGLPRFNHEPITPADLPRLVRAKYESRIAHGKDDARERRACREVV